MNIVYHLIILFLSTLTLYFFFLMIRRPPRSTLFPTRRSSDLFSANRSSISANRLGVLAATAALGAAPQSCNTSRGLGSCCLSSGAAATRRQCGGLSSREKFPRSRTGSDTPERSEEHTSELQSR